MKKEMRISFNRKIAVILLIFITSTSCNASMPLPEEITLEEYVKNYSPMIFLGDFKGIVHIKRGLGEKLMNPSAEIAPSELILQRENFMINGGESFIEINDMELLYSPKGDLKSACNYPVAYQVQQISLQGDTEIEHYYRSVTGKRVVFFLSGPGRFGKNPITFPTPLFYSAGGVNWRDGAPLPTDRLEEIRRIATSAGLVKVDEKECRNRTKK